MSSDSGCGVPQTQAADVSHASKAGTQQHQAAFPQFACVLHPSWGSFLMLFDSPFGRWIAGVAGRHWTEQPPDRGACRVQPCRVSPTTLLRSLADILPFWLRGPRATLSAFGCDAGVGGLKALNPTEQSGLGQKVKLALHCQRLERRQEGAGAAELGSWRRSGSELCVLQGGGPALCARRRAPRPAPTATRRGAATGGLAVSP